MSLDLIKSFLVGIGFDIDQQSFDKANKSIDNAGKKIKEFNDSNNEGFSETSNSLKDLFSLLNSSHTIGSLFPGLRKPLKGLLLDLRSIKEYYDNLSKDKDVSKEFIKKKETVKDKVNETVKNVAKETVKVKNIVNEKLVNKTEETSQNIKTENIKNILNEQVKNMTKKLIEKKEFAKNIIKENIKDIDHEKVKNISEKFTEKKESVRNKINETIRDIKTNKIDKKVIETEVINKKKFKNKESIPKLNKERVLSAPNVKNVKNSKESLKMITGASKETAIQVEGLKKGLGSLLSKGGASLKAFSVTSVTSLAVVAGAILGVIALITAFIVYMKKLASYINKLAEKDIEIEKLSRMLWTTKEVAEEVSQALGVLGASIEDLWLSPTLLKQFNQLRKDASQVRLPKEFQDNLKLVQDLGFEFKRTKQLIEMLFKWIAHYILKYLKNPLGDAKDELGDFNTWLMENIPKIAEVIGTTIGVGIKFLIILGKILAFLWKLTSPFWKIIKLVSRINKGIDNLSDGTKKAARIILSALLFAFSPLLLVIALIDDLLTFIRGGESVIGDTLDWIKNNWDEFIDSLIDKFWILRKILNIKDSAKDWWDSYYDSAKENFDKLHEKAKTVLSDIKEWSKSTFDKGKDWVYDKWNKGKEFLNGKDIDKNDFINIGKRVIDFNNNYGESPGAVTNSYMTNTNNTSRTTNSNNKVTNENKITVYSNDPVSTGNTIDKRLTSISSRNLQGAIE